MINRALFNTVKQVPSTLNCRPFGGKACFLVPWQVIYHVLCVCIYIYIRFGATGVKGGWPSGFRTSNM